MRLEPSSSAEWKVLTPTEGLVCHLHSAMWLSPCGLSLPSPRCAQGSLKVSVLPLEQGASTWPFVLAALQPLPCQCSARVTPRAGGDELLFWAEGLLLSLIRSNGRNEVRGENGEGMCVLLAGVVWNM